MGDQKKKESELIRVSGDTKKRLNKLGKFKESYDDILKRVLDIFELKAVKALTEEKSCSQQKAE